MNKGRIITALATILAIPAMAAPAGYFQLPGTETTMMINGKAETWGVYGFDGFNDVTSVSGHDQSWNKTGQVDSWVNARVNINTTTPSAHGDVKVRVEFQGGTGTGTSAGPMKLRHAYGEFAGLLVGQTDSLFSAWHNSPNYYDSFISDFNGTSRIRQIRYTFAPAEGFQVGFSMEQDQTGDAETGQTKITNLAPQLVGAVNYSADWGGVVVSLGYQKKEEWTGYPANTTKSGTGLSFAISGAFTLNDANSFTAMYQNGGSWYGPGLLDGFFVDGTTYGFYKGSSYNVGYTHTWNSEFQTNAGIGQTILPKDTKAGVAEKVTISELFVNTSWQVTKNAKFAAEYLWQQTKVSNVKPYTDKDGNAQDTNSDKRLKLMFRYTFF